MKALKLIAGPCMIEGEQLCLDVAGHMKELSEAIGFEYIFKASFDKANRSSHMTARGPGLEEGLRILSEVKRQIGVPVLTDVHEYTPIEEVASVVDVLQTPAMLCRQTDFIQRVAAAGKPVNLKKGQFLEPAGMVNVVNKARAAGAKDLMVCERGFCFGYGDLIVDMRSLVELRETGCPVIFDATHSVQRPGALGTASGGQRKYVAPLARAAVAVGVAGLFMETHPSPDQAMSDGPNMVPLGAMRDLLLSVVELDRTRVRMASAQLRGQLS